MVVQRGTGEVSEKRGTYASGGERPLCAIDKLKSAIPVEVVFWVDRLYAELKRKDPSPERLFQRLSAVRASVTKACGYPLDHFPKLLALDDIETDLHSLSELLERSVAEPDRKKREVYGQAIDISFGRLINNIGELYGTRFLFF